VLRDKQLMLLLFPSTAYFRSLTTGSISSSWVPVPG